MGGACDVITPAKELSSPLDQLIVFTIPDNMGTPERFDVYSAIRRQLRSQLLLPGVAVEKVVFFTNGLKSGDRKCLPDPRKSLVGHPGAMNFSRILRV